MDAAKIHDAVNSLLECSICYEIYQDHHILPCHHTFCLNCIKKIIGLPCVCSLCKSSCIQPPANDLKKLPKDYVVDSFITSLPSFSACFLAGEEKQNKIKYSCINF